MRKVACGMRIGVNVRLSEVSFRLNNGVAAVAMERLMW